MADPLSTLFQLTDLIQDLDMVQGWINDARVAVPRNQHVQLMLDRKQSEVDRKRALIAGLMCDIRSRN